MWRNDFGKCEIEKEFLDVSVILEQKGNTIHTKQKHAYK